MHGTLVELELDAPALAGNPLGDPGRRPLLVYLPPGHRPGLPAVYLLHGFGGSARNWCNVSTFAPTVPERIDAAIAAGALPPFVAVFPDGATRLGGTQWIDAPAVGRYQTYVARFGTRADRAARAVLGKSSGGYGALRMGRDRPDVFAHVACHSGDAYFEYCYLADLPKAAAAPLGLALPFELPSGRLRADVWARWLAEDPVRFVPASLDAFRRLATVFLDCGTRDEYHLRWGARMIADALRSGGVEVVHEEFEDGHGGINYRLDRSLAVIVPRMVEPARANEPRSP
jgi:pimeloyl-ACP methyl ester carboxylesterase